MVADIFRLSLQKRTIISFSRNTVPDLCEMYRRIGWHDFIFLSVCMVHTKSWVDCSADDTAAHRWFITIFDFSSLSSTNRILMPARGLLSRRFVTGLLFGYAFACLFVKSILFVYHAGYDSFLERHGIEKNN